MEKKRKLQKLTPQEIETIKAKAKEFEELSRRIMINFMTSHLFLYDPRKMKLLLDEMGNNGRDLLYYLSGDLDKAISSIDEGEKEQ